MKIDQKHSILALWTPLPPPTWSSILTFWVTFLTFGGVKSVSKSGQDLSVFEKGEFLIKVWTPVYWLFSEGMDLKKCQKVAKNGKKHVFSHGFDVYLPVPKRQTGLLQDPPRVIQNGRLVYYKNAFWTPFFTFWHFLDLAPDHFGPRFWLLDPPDRPTDPSIDFGGLDPDFQVLGHFWSLFGHFLTPDRKHRKIIEIWCLRLVYYKDCWYFSKSGKSALFRNASNRCIG